MLPAESVVRAIGLPPVVPKIVDVPPGVIFDTLFEVPLAV